MTLKKGRLGDTWISSSTKHTWPPGCLVSSVTSAEFDWLMCHGLVQEVHKNYYTPEFSMPVDDFIDPAASNWLNIIPNLKGKIVLKFGSNNINSIDAIIRSGCNSLTCITRKKIPERNSRLISVEDWHFLCVWDMIYFTQNNYMFQLLLL